MKHEAKFSVILPSGSITAAQIETFEQTATRYGLSVKLPLRTDSNGNLIASTGLSLREAQMLRRQIANCGFAADVISDTTQFIPDSAASQNATPDTLVVDLNEIPEINESDSIGDITSEAWSSLEMPSSLDLGLGNADVFDDDSKWNGENWLSPDVSKEGDDGKEKTLSLNALDLLSAAQNSAHEVALGTIEKEHKTVQQSGSASSVFKKAGKSEGTNSTIDVSLDVLKQFKAVIPATQNQNAATSTKPAMQPVSALNLPKPGLKSSQSNMAVKPDTAMSKFGSSVTAKSLTPVQPVTSYKTDMKSAATVKDTPEKETISVPVNQLQEEPKTTDCEVLSEEIILNAELILSEKAEALANATKEQHEVKVPEVKQETTPKPVQVPAPGANEPEKSIAVPAQSEAAQAPAVDSATKSDAPVPKPAEESTAPTVTEPKKDEVVTADQGASDLSSTTENGKSVFYKLSMAAMVLVAIGLLIATIYAFISPVSFIEPFISPLF